MCREKNNQETAQIKRCKRAKTWEIPLSIKFSVDELLTTKHMFEYKQKINKTLSI